MHQGDRNAECDRTSVDLRRGLDTSLDASGMPTFGAKIG